MTLPEWKPVLPDTRLFSWIWVPQTRLSGVVVGDILAILLLSYGCFVVRLEQFWLHGYWMHLVVLNGLTVLFLLGKRSNNPVSRACWSSASLEDFLQFARVAVVRGILVASCLLIISRGGMLALSPMPLAVPLLFAVLLPVGLLAPRLVLRLVARPDMDGPTDPAVLPVLIAGSGQTVIVIARLIADTPDVAMQIVGVVVDESGTPLEQNGPVSVLGTWADIPVLVRRHHIRLVLTITTTGRPPAGLEARCKQADVPIRVIPDMAALLRGHVPLQRTQSVRVEDLLHRAPVALGDEAVGQLLRGRCVLVTGAGGSIGSELCRQILRFQPGQIVLMGHGENSIFTIYHELQPKSQYTQLLPVIADTRFPERIQTIFDTYHPDLVFHAAAHKHVPMMELNPVEAITNNVYGTRNLLNAALLSGVEHFVMISTDKAVNPTSIMGQSKRLAELLVAEAAHRSGKAYATVRFGNVLGSRGSVMLTFQEQIARGGPVTVTHPEMQRFFMTIPEAVQLTLQAAEIGQGGEVFVLDMGQPVRIVDLARDMIRLSGLEVGRDIDIVFTGIRPGEKLYEDLFSSNESHSRTTHHKIFRVSSMFRPCSAVFIPRVERLILLALQQREPEMLALLEDLFRHIDCWSETDGAEVLLSTGIKNRIVSG